MAVGQCVQVEQQLLAGRAGWSGAESSAGLGGVQSSGSVTGTRQLAPYSFPSKERP